MTNRDAYTHVSSSQDIGDGSTTSFVSTNSIPVAVALGPGGAAVLRDIGSGAKLKFRVMIAEALDADLTLRVDAILAPEDDLTGALAVVGCHLVDTNIAILGTEFDVPIAPIPAAILDAAGVGEFVTAGGGFLGLRYVLSAASSVGKVSAWMPLGDSPGTPRRYAGNYTGP